MVSMGAYQHRNQLGKWQVPRKERVHCDGQKRQGSNRNVVQHDEKGWLKAPKTPLAFCTIIQNLRFGVTVSKFFCLYK